MSTKMITASARLDYTNYPEKILQLPSQDQSLLQVRKYFYNWEIHGLKTSLRSI